jgi:3-oxoacyl-[acyl-carrier protein] reductase
MDLFIKGKKALVTGGTKGIGRAIAQTLAAEGAQVLSSAREKADLGSGIEVFPCDLTEVESRKALIEQTKKVLGAVDILVHNVGGPAPSDVLSTSAEAWRSGFERLFQSVSHLNEAFIPGMRERKFGRVICVTSLSVVEPIAGLAVSNALRSAVTAMLKTLADEVAADGITVNCVAPGAIDTERLKSLMQARIARTGQSAEEYEKQYLSAIPAGRLGTPEEFASCVAYLASRQAAYITGSTIAIDGGKRRSTY